jgi:hypothetical protein
MTHGCFVHGCVLKLLAAACGTWWLRVYAGDLVARCNESLEDGNGKDGRSEKGEAHEA